MFVDNIEELQMREVAVAAGKQARLDRRGESDEDESEEEAAAPAVASTPEEDAERAAAMEKMVQERKAKAIAAKAAAGSDDEDTVFNMKKMGISKNPNAKSSSGRTEFSVKGLASAEVGGGRAGIGGCMVYYGVVPR
jgi:hypothetical protein